MALRPAILVSLLLLAFVRAQRIATVHEVQPSSRDVVHSVWVNGPAFSAKLPSGASSAWPQFQAGVATRAGSQCSRDDTRYTGYDDSGLYCEAASPALDENAHLLLYSGRLGVVVDAGGLAAQASSNTRNLFAKLGALGGRPGRLSIVTTVAKVAIAATERANATERAGSDDGDGANHADRYLEGPYMKAARRKRSSMDVSAPNLPDGA